MNMNKPLTILWYEPAVGEMLEIADGMFFRYVSTKPLTPDIVYKTFEEIPRWLQPYFEAKLCRISSR